MAMPVYAQDFNYPFNDTMTTDFGPAFADIIIQKSNFLPCKGGPIAQCGTDGSSCKIPNSAPVCETINNGTFIPGADMISTFSFECIPTEGIGSTDCTQPPSIPYAGCMTAPCNRTEEDGIANCFCPTFDGPFQIGLNDQLCNLDSDMVWSAAFNPNASGTSPILPPGVCIPDAPESNGGCPLLMKMKYLLLQPILTAVRYVRSMKILRT
jgi:hypothetical protein